jgi:heme exporter protein C
MGRVKHMPVKEVQTDMTETTRSGDAIRAAAQGAVQGLWWKVLCGLLMAATIVYGLAFVGPATGFTMGGHGAKVIFFHVPCAWMASLAYIVGAWYAARWLAYTGAQQRSRLSSPDDRAGLRVTAWVTLIAAVVVSVAFFRIRPLVWSFVTLAILAAAVLVWLRERPGADADSKSAAAMELGFLFGILATVTGSIFSRNEWGSYWNWDPRQTSILIMLLIFAAYVVLRGAIPEPDRRARLSAVYTLVAVVPGLFMIWIVPRIVQTLHEGPNNTIVGGQIGGNYRVVMYGLALPAFLLLYTWLLQLRVRLLKLESRQTL